MDKTVEKNRRYAFLGVLIKYTMTPLLWLYGSVFAVLLGMFLYNFFKTVRDAQEAVSFFDQLWVLPLVPAFFCVTLGTQLLLSVGFVRLERNKFAMKRILLLAETKERLRRCYVIGITVISFAVYFLMLCVLLLAENFLSPGTAYGGAELYPVFYKMMHLYKIYPVTNGMAWMMLFLSVLCLSGIPVKIARAWQERESMYLGEVVFALYVFLYYVCVEDQLGKLRSYVFLLIYCISIIGSEIIRIVKRSHIKKTMVPVIGEKEEEQC